MGGEQEQKKKKKKRIINADNHAAPPPRNNTGRESDQHLHSPTFLTVLIVLTNYICTVWLVPRQTRGAAFLRNRVFLLKPSDAPQLPPRIKKRQNTFPQYDEKGEMHHFYSGVPTCARGRTIHKADYFFITAYRPALKTFFLSTKRHKTNNELT